MRIVALEGPSYVGKTTAIDALVSASLIPEDVVFDCYVRDMPSGLDVPPPRTFSHDAQMAAFEVFMQIEGQRIERLAQLVSIGTTPELVILDRSVDTLLAHAYALDTLFDFGVWESARARLRSLPHLVPDRTIYLDAAPGCVRTRRERCGEDSAYFLHDSGFLAASRNYFLDSTTQLISRHIAVVSATGSRGQVQARVAALL